MLARARAAGVAAMVVTGSTLADTEKAIALCRRHPDLLRATAGVHPHHAAALGDADAARLAELARGPDGGRGRRMRARLLPELLAARRAAPGIRAPARPRRAAGQAALPAPARRARRLPRDAARPSGRRGARGAALLHRGSRHARGMPRARAFDRRDRLDLRRAARPGAARGGAAHPGGPPDARDGRALPAAAHAAAQAPRTAATSRHSCRPCSRRRRGAAASRRRRWRARPPAMPAASLALHWPRAGTTRRD